jgi:hypothetical protein
VRTSEVPAQVRGAVKSLRPGEIADSEDGAVEVVVVCDSSRVCEYLPIKSFWRPAPPVAIIPGDGHQIDIGSLVVEIVDTPVHLDGVIFRVVALQIESVGIHWKILKERAPFPSRRAFPRSTGWQPLPLERLSAQGCWRDQAPELGPGTRTWIPGVV